MQHDDMGDGVTLTPNLPDLVRQARNAIDSYHRLLAEQGVTPESCLAEVRRGGGEAAVAKIRREAEANVRSIDERIERDAMHAPASSRPMSRRMARRGGGI